MCTQQLDSGLTGSRPLRMSNASHIRLIISRFETKNERAPTKNTATLREINNINKRETLQRDFAPLKTINEIKSDLNNKSRNITDELCKASDHAKTYRSTNNSVNIRRLSESETNSETDNEDITVFPKQWNNKCSSEKWIFPQFRCDIVSEVVVRVVGDCLQSAGRTILRCLPPVSPHNLAVVTVITSASVPRMVTNLLIYPSCRLVFGTLYPAYASYKAVRTKNVKEYVKWMMYWIVFALFTCAETITDVFFSWFPFYYEVKILLVIWLLSPATKGSSILYRKFVHPALCRREQEIDEYISKAKDQGYHTVLNLGTKGVNYATNVIMQTAIKGGGGLVQQLRRSYSLSDLSVSDDHIDSRSQQELDEAEDLVLTDPRLVRRSTVGGRGRNPRPHSSPRVDMIFPEVDLLSHNRAVSGGRDKFSHIRSSEDISSAYVPEGAIGPDGLLRTASVGGSTRTRSKVTRSTFTSIKRPGAAEDEDVFIEEMEDGTDPSEFLRNILPIPQDDGTVCLPYSKDILSQYLRFIMNSEVQGRKKEVDDGDAEYKQYLKLKEVYDSDSLQDAVKLRCITPSDPGKLESKDANLKHTTPTVQEKNTISNPPVVIAESKSIDKKVDSEPTKKTDNVLVVDDKSKPVVLEEIKKAVKETFSKSASSPTSDAFVDKQDKISEGSLSIGGKDIEDSNKVVEEITSQSPTTLKPDAYVDKLDKISEESRSIGVSSSNLSSDDETGEGDFTTPNSSPIMKNKINRNGKNKKRHAPPPPVCHSSSPSDKNDAENPVKQQSGTKLDTKNSITFTLGESPLNYGSLVDLGPTASVTSVKRSESSITSQSPIKRKQRTKSRSSVKESPLSKLIHLPAKFAFWNTGEDGKASGSDNEESNDSVHDNSSLSDYGSTSNVRNWKGEQPGDGEVPATTALSKQDIDEDHFVDAENGSLMSTPPTVISGSPTSNDKLEEMKDKKVKEEEQSKVKLGNVQVKPELDNVTFIPLKIETLMMNTESKSTDV